MRGLAAPLVKLVTFVVITVVFTAILGVSIANLSFTGAKSYSARFTDATMLLEGDDVRIAGVVVGQVASVEVVDRRVAEVKFEVDQQRTMPAGVTATIKFRNLIGQRYLELNKGTGTPGGKFEPGDTIPLERTEPALDLTELFNGFKPLFRALNPEDVNKLSYEIIQVLQGEGGTVESLLKHTASLTSTIAEKDQVIGAVINNLNSVLETVNARTPQLSDLIVRLQQFVSGLSSDRKQIGNAIESLGALNTTTAGLVEDVREPLRQDIAALGELTRNLNEHEPLVEHFIRFLPEKVTRLTATADYGSWFNFFQCSAQGTVTVGPETIPVPLGHSDAERCQ